MVLVCVPGVLMVDYAAGAPAHSPYPTAAAVGADYDDHVGRTVHFWARVQTTDGPGFTVRYAGGALRVVDARAPVETGDWVQVYGTLRPERRIDARRVVVSHLENRRYMFAVSALAVVLAAGAFLRRWTLDATDLTFRPRDR